MKPSMKKRAYQYNRERAREKEMGDDLMILLQALPPGQVKHLLKDETCGAILRKYGIEG